MNLYELSKEFAEVEQRLDELETEDENALVELLALVEVDGNQCAEYLLKMERNLKASITARKAEIARLQAMTKSEENRKDNIRNYILNWLKRSGQKNIKTEIATASVTKGSHRLEVDVDRVKDWPAEAYDAAIENKVVIETIEVKKTALKATFVNYLDLPGVFEVVGDDTLTIR